jgi:hypothetical protein
MAASFSNKTSLGNRDQISLFSESSRKCAAHNSATNTQFFRILLKKFAIMSKEKTFRLHKSFI